MDKVTCGCGKPVALRYPGNDPEMGPARFECKAGHVPCQECGAWKDTNGNVDGICEACYVQAFHEDDACVVGCLGNGGCFMCAEDGSFIEG